MEYRTLDINVVSGKDLNKVNLITKMDVYVVISISGADDDRSNQKTKTHVDHDGDNNPTWNFPIKFTIDDNAAVQNRLHLVFKLRCQKALGDKDIGQVDVPIKELLESSNSSNGSKQFVSYQIRKPSGKPKGQLTFSYQFSDRITGNTVVDSKIENPVTANPALNPTPMVGSTSVYPPPPPQQGPSGLYPPPPTYACGGSGPAPPPQPMGYPPPASAGYPPQPMGYPPPASAGYPPQPMGYPPPASAGYPPQPMGYPPPASAGYPPQPMGYPPVAAGGYGYPPAMAYPPPTQYGYPPQQGGHGYGYPQVQRPAKKNNNLALGLGAGLLGGALGGMIIGDAISDVGGGYDGGFGDIGGFDF